MYLKTALLQPNVNFTAKTTGLFVLAYVRKNSILSSTASVIRDLSLIRTKYAS